MKEEQGEESKSQQASMSLLSLIMGVIMILTHLECRNPLSRHFAQSVEHNS